jgi:hypothetical protein
MTKCPCGRAKRAQSRRENKNKGRYFYSCKPCDFFEWGPFGRAQDWLTAALSAAKVKKKRAAGCVCKSGPRSFQCLNGGDNHGRWAKACKTCDFFQWGEQGEVSTEDDPKPVPVPNYTVDLNGVQLN